MFGGSGYWDDDQDDSDDEELPDIEEFSAAVSTVFTKPKRPRKAPASPRKRNQPGDRSPNKHRSTDTGLPDIDDGTKGIKESNKNKRKRTVAIVEPMKPVSFEEAIGAGAYTVAERKRKAKNMSSPTLDNRTFGGGRSKSSVSAIEILQEDSELLPIPGYTPTHQNNASTERKRRSEGRSFEANNFSLFYKNRIGNCNSDLKNFIMNL
jgi:hypothetical protein